MVHSNKKDFAFETTLAAKSYFRIIKEAQQCGYFVTLVFFWLNSLELAIERVKTRFQAGGHNVETTTIIRRYRSGILNLFDLYIPISDYWLIIDNSNHPSKLISEGKRNNFITTYDHEIFETLKSVQK